MIRIVVVIGLIFLASHSINAAAQRAHKPPTDALIRCESVGGREDFCPADTRRGVQLVQAIGGRCQLGRSWGYDASGIWVRGCSAEFALGAGDGASGWGWGYQHDNRSTCASENFRYALCEGNTRGGVRLVNQISHTECIEGSTWGSDRRGIWVDKGCAGEFELGAANSGIAGGGRRPGSSDEGNLPTATGETFTCESRDGRRRYCAADLRGRSVAVVRNISREPCAEGSNFGVDRRGVWVDGGCRAEFRIIENATDSDRQRPEFDAQARTVRCESKDFRRASCRIGTVSRVELGRQTSNARCIQGQTWGTDRDGVWVDQGCAGDFYTYR